MPFEFSIPIPDDQLGISVEPGSSVIFVGANGGGKTRLAVQIETQLELNAHRISAHRALNLNPDVQKISEEKALQGLRIGRVDGRAGVQYRNPYRWHGNAAVELLNDFDFLMQALFADQINKSLETHKRARAGKHEIPNPTKFERLTKIWEHLLPDRKLSVSGDDIEVMPAESEAKYKAADMSDGERAIFYMIGQTLTAAESCLLIMDEPELHVHRSIMAKLWDELEAARPDCAFVFITHDLEFAASRVAQKFVIRSYDPTPGPSTQCLKTQDLTRRAQLLFSAAEGPYFSSRAMRTALMLRCTGAAIPTGRLFRGDLARQSSTPLSR